MLYVLVNGGLVPADDAPEVKTPVQVIPKDVVDSITEFEDTLGLIATAVLQPVALPVVPEIK